MLLTLTLASGVVFSEELFGRALRLNHKTVFAILVLADLRRCCSPAAGATAGAAGGRCAGRSPASCMLLLAYVGSKFVLEVILGRSLA